MILCLQMQKMNMGHIQSLPWSSTMSLGVSEEAKKGPNAHRIDKFQKIKERRHLRDVGSNLPLRDIWTAEDLCLGTFVSNLARVEGRRASFRSPLVLGSRTNSLGTCACVSIPAEHVVDMGIIAPARRSMLCGTEVHTFMHAYQSTFFTR